MTKLEIAHVREQGQDMIIAALDRSFDSKSSDQQQATVREIEVAAHSAGLAGAACVVWDAGGGRMKFIAPSQWHAFFRSIDLRWVLANQNKSLSW
ncbi:hypothetical protein AB4Z52_07035 [Rhizobium sp. 2YAF20]|uniref:hypothetical protein n=1 Tax=Rhizobium sp. 2YAF20 TaxID=3233027 RepID=UPI003F95A1E4